MNPLLPMINMIRDSNKKDNIIAVMKQTLEFMFYETGSRRWTKFETLFEDKEEWHKTIKETLEKVG